MNRSPERNTFQMQAYIDRCRDEGQEPSEQYLDLYRQETIRDLEHEHDEEWKINNLEYDLRSTEWICAKAKASEVYAQNIYAALCNQDWQRNDVWPRLKDETYSCSWRYAGGIVANMVEHGDYIDWYCSGIRGDAIDEAELAAMSEEDRVKYFLYQEKFVPEGTVTDEIREDFFKLGWIPVDDNGSV